jgi:hypothetical protein
MSDKKPLDVNNDNSNIDGLMTDEKSSSNEKTLDVGTSASTNTDELKENVPEVSNVTVFTNKNGDGTVKVSQTGGNVSVIVDDDAVNAVMGTPHTGGKKSRRRRKGKGKKGKSMKRRGTRGKKAKK